MGGMKHKQTIQPLIKNIKQTLKSQVHGIKQVGALLYLCLSSLIIPKQTPMYDRIQNYSYKALASCPVEGQDLLSAFVQPAFEEDFRKWLDQEPFYKSRHPVISRIDASKLGRHYGNTIPHMKWQYDYVTKSNIKTLCIYVLLISIGDKEYIGGYTIPQLEGDTGSNLIAQDLFSAFYDALPSDLKQPFQEWGRVALDGGWGNGTMVSWLKEKGYHHVVIKSGGKDKVVDSCGHEYASLRDYEDMLISTLDDESESWRQFNSCYHLDGVWYYTEKVTLQTKNTEVQVVLLKYPAKKAHHKDRYLMLLSLPEEDWHSHQIVKAYKGRWGIETMFKTGKQRFDWEKIGYHIKKIIHYPSEGVIKERTDEEVKANQELAFQRINRYLALRFMSYMIVNWYRVEWSRPSKTSLAQVIDRWKKYFDTLSPKAIQNLFAGYS